MLEKRRSEPSRRALLTGAVGVAMASASQAQAEVGEPAPAAYGPGRLIQVRGKRLYVEISGPETAPALVFIHGGPGTGSWDFGDAQKALLSRKLRLIQFDQRGAFRSDAVGEAEPFSLHELVEDVEALRLALGIRRWSALCHSFGGLIETRYALAYPDGIDKLLFDNPTLDIGSSDRNQLVAVAAQYRKLGKADRADEALAASREPITGRDAWLRFTRIANGLPFDARMDTFVHSLPTGYTKGWIDRSGLPMELWMKGSGPSQVKLWQDPAVFEDLQPRLARIDKPMLLLKGRYDYTTAPDQVQSFARHPRARTVWFENSGHLPESEEPERFAEAVTDFVLS